MEVSKQKSRLPGWQIGVLLSEIFWLLAFTFCFAAQNGWLPRSLMRLEVVQTFDAVCGLFALPIAVGGWLYVWGDTDPPYQWMNSPVINIALGILFYGLAGGLLGYLATLSKHRQFSLKAMLIVTTLFALLLGFVTGLLNLVRSPVPWR
jgi:hypothetical protein